MERTFTGLDYYDDETYLFNYVGPRFRESGELSATDFYTLLAWKANRAKERHRDRLKARPEFGSFAEATRTLASLLYNADSAKDRLRILLTDPFNFYMPTATAILTVLYPDVFTVYDYRVRGLLTYADLSQRAFSDLLWQQYVGFVEAVRAYPPSESALSLRDCDRWMSGECYRMDLEAGCIK